jgi:hypothetical protein
MAEKKTTPKKDSKKASRKANPKSVDMMTQQMQGDDTGLELTEKMTMMDTPVGDSVDLGEPMVDFREDMKVETREVADDAAECAEPVDMDDHSQDACMQERNQEIETVEPAFEKDDEMVNDITNILNGLDGVNARRLGDGSSVEEETEPRPAAGKNMTNTEEKNYYSEQFSKSWGGVVYDY